MGYLQLLVLGLIQGIAEFLPISSAGHLVVIAALLQQYAHADLPETLELTIVLHAGTLGSILVVYWQRILRIFGPDRRVIGLVVVGTLPAVVFGLPVHECEPLRDALHSPLLVGCMLPLTGLMLIFASRRPAGTTDYTEMSYRQALIIGLCQSLALFPGISRSGITIAAGLLVGLRRDAAATFSFLLAIAAITGAVVLALKDVVTSNSTATPEQMRQLAAGAVMSFVAGVFALRLLIAWLNRGRLHWFAAWCIPAGLAVVTWQLLLK
jgi:undecaprenyl-diphosphatase